MLVSSKVLNGLNGVPIIPGDKSISHRSIIISSISKGTCEISNLLFSDDVINTLKAFQQMGVHIEKNKDKIIVKGNGLESLNPTEKEINLGNSGTSARLLIGLLASQKFISKLIGDESLSHRPMKRIMDPLEQMGAKFKSATGSLPIKIYGQNLKNFRHELVLPSAQVKSGIILAALNTSGKTTLIEKKITRNHTEILLKSFGANINIIKNGNQRIISIIGKKELSPKNISVPSDLSSAAFFIIAALINKNSNIKMNNINLNPTREGIISSLYKMGAQISISNKRLLNGEHVADLTIISSKLKGCELDENEARLMIDEYPILSIAASFAETPSLFRGLSELRVKESNRLDLIQYNLTNCGIFCKVEGDDLFIDPTKKMEVKNNIIKTNNDHRIAMAFIIMGSKLGIDLEIEDSQFIKTSFPNFSDTLNKVGGNIIE